MDELLEQTISHYRVISLLGAGGMGEVYRAHDARLDRDLALKILPCDLMKDENARARLIGEARTASALSHPHIGHVYDVGEDRGHMFFAMELIEGKPLRDAIPRGGLPLSTVCQYGAQIASALAYAHERGIVHRDLKSANVMVTPEGRVKVLDFGLAKRIQDGRREELRDPDLTATGMILGTPNYLPPEVLLGGSADARSDIWALGVLLYEMASGKLPFDGSSVAELAGAIVNEAPNPLSARVPTGLQLIIARCLAKDPHARYRSASEVEAALEAIDPSAIRSTSRQGTWRVWGMTAGAVTILVLAVILAMRTADIQKRLSDGDASGGGPRPHIGSLAVLPLANLSGDPTQEYFADGMTEELITNLAPIRSLKVISRTSVMPFKGSRKSLKEIASALDVDAVIEGSVLRAGDKVRITAQLIEAAKDRHLWAKSYEREVKDVLGLQSEVARDIAGEIQLQLSPEEHARMMLPRRTVNPEAYELYLRGRYEWSKVSPEGVAKSIDYYEKALALDPGDARYSSGLADAYLLQVQVLGTLPQKEGMAKVKEYAKRALGADDSSPEAHTSMAIAVLFADWNWKEAEHHAQRAIQLNAGYSTAHLVYSVILATAGRTNEAIEQDHLAADLDPLSLIVSWNAASTYFYARRYDQALAQATHTVAMDPSSHLPHGAMARTYEETGRYQASLDLLEQHLPVGDTENRAAVAALKQAFATHGTTGYWRTMLRFETAENPKNPKDKIRVAMIYLKLGDREKAFYWLERAYAEHAGDMIFINIEPCFDPIRTDPRFQALVRKVGFPPPEA
ncbi:MAG: tetratricopeptide repeat protein [Candidatus Eisenbacteria bacterium]|uniref:non-specific serine/threonine protein kinase n=1 Tax=Eiseniibacteriota bacterium TaxID=2212470 RepID=A0A538SCB6_UNCEI|nr:MAG: tetratricopeptide repeat protein [Candidatus Eisenbacteria bacterium]